MERQDVVKQTALEESETSTHSLRAECHELERKNAALAEEVRQLRQSETLARLNEERLESLYAISHYQASSTQELLDFTLHEAIRLTGSQIGYIYLYDEETQLFNLNSWSREVMAECRVMNPQTTYHLEKTGIWGEAVRQRKPILVNDFQAPDPHKKGYPAGHVELTRFLTLPVLRDENIVAVIGVGNKKAEYDPSDIRQLTLLINAAWVYVNHVQTQAELRESEERYRTTIYSIGDGVITTDPAGGIRQMNRLAEEMTGWSEHEARGHALDEVFQITHPDSQTLRVNPIQRVLTEGIVIGLENHTQLISRDGRQRPIADSGAPIRNDKGAIAGAVLVFRDQTSEYQAQEALHQAEKKYRQLFENLTAGMALHEIILDGEGRPCDYRFMEINAAFAEITGLKAEDVIGRTVREVIPGIEEGWIETYGRVALTGEAVVFENYDNVLKKHWHVVAYCPQIGQFAVVFTDITPQKQVSLQIQRLNDELEQRVSVRTAQLEAANQELEAFAYSVSHDLRAPLRAMKGYSEILAEECSAVLTSQGKHYLSRIQDSSKRMDLLISDLLNLSKVARGAVRRSPVDLSGIVQLISANLQAQSPERRVDWKIQDGLKAYGDEQLLQDVLQNLLENAFKFTTPRSPAQVEFSMAQPDGAQVYCVRDNGVGFDMAYADKLFRPFQRMHSENEFPGTGIGLATVARIIQRHGGRIWCEAEVERGAAFYFTLNS